MSLVTALCAGLLFGVGLLLSGMANPANVLGFLDVAGDWNPALALTMGGAIAVAAPAFYYVRRRSQAVLTGERAPPSGKRIDRKLLGGAAIFGVGWGLSGICPGPALILLTSLAPGAFVFVGSMIVGMLLAERTSRSPAAEPRATHALRPDE
jgi:uncharacterized membrane protein YedE/YeeE